MADTGGVPLMNKAIALVLLGLCLVLAFVAASWGIADMQDLEPRYLMSRWDQGKKVTLEDWQRAADLAESAHRMHPSNSEYVYDLAKLYEWRSLEKMDPAADPNQDRLQAIEYYQQAAALRPVWARAWINIAWNELRGSDDRSRGVVALDNAATYGPWEGGVYYQLIWMGLATWEDLPEVTRDRIRYIIKLKVTGRDTPKYIQDLVDEFEWQGELDKLVTGDS